MNEQLRTVELTDEELQIIHHALRSYLEDFGHEEADILRAVKALLAKLPSGERYFE
jgi:hypothetical protein